MQQTNSIYPTRKVSIFRVFIALTLLFGIGYGAVIGWQDWNSTEATAEIEPWFAPYVDVTAIPEYAFEQLNISQTKNLILSFIVSDPQDACIPSWGGYYTMDEAREALELDRRIARFRQQGGQIMVSFGGLLNDELAMGCTDEEQLLQAYLSVIERYNLNAVDFDLEGAGLTDRDALKRRAQVIARLQQAIQTDGDQLSVWLTLPVASQGLTQDGTTAVSEALLAGIKLSGVNVMTMNYGQSKAPNSTMSQTSKVALTEVHRQLGIIYYQAGISLSDTALWRKIGATPMIGQNDVVNEIFTLDDAIQLNAFASEKGLVQMSMWSINRDVPCGGNYVNVTVVSSSCSGIKQDKFKFMQLLSVGFSNPINSYTELGESENAIPTNIIDDPTTSPYQIWDESGTYQQGTKVVWHGNVYQAKWWTKGNLPDHPVLQSWETPWQLIGPVLPDEKPIPPTTLPKGTYAEWSGLNIYEAGERVLFNGVPYQAKWWTQGDSPAASAANPDSSPWIALTKEQIEAIID